MQNDTTAQRSLTAAQKQAAIDRARGRAIEQAAAGNLPILLRRYLDKPEQTHEVWSVPSRTTQGTHYIVTVLADCDGVATECECPAAGPCWHRAAVRMAIFGEIERRQPQPPAKLALTAADLSGHVTDWTIEAAD